MLFRVFFLAAFAFLIWQLGRLFEPFLTPLMASATLVLVAYPLHRRMVRALGGREDLAAACSTVALLLVIILPLLLMGWLLSRQASALIPAAQGWGRTIRDGSATDLESVLPAPAVQALDHLERVFDDWGLSVRGLILSGLDKLGEQLGALGGSFVRNILIVVLDVFVLVFGAFFFLRDGAAMVRGIVGYVPMEPAHKVAVLGRLERTFTAVVRGVFITASVHGLLAGMGYAIVGLPFAVLLGFAAAILALVPVIGPALVWVPACAYVALTGPRWAAIFLIAWAVIVVLVVDNVLKPLLIKERAQMSTFLSFFGIVGGIEVYGILGVFIGPLVIALLLAFADIYRERFQSAEAPLAPGDS